VTRLVVTASLTLDGVMQAPGGPEEDPTGGFRHGGWSAPYWDESMAEQAGEALGKPFALLLGRKTYEIFAAHWPYVTSRCTEARY
jgi:dihydrofolate reductase